MNSQDGKSDSRALMLAVLAGNCIAVVGWWVQPETIFGLMRGLALSETSAALVASAEVTMVAFTSIALGFRGGRSHRQLALLGTGIALLGHALSILSSSYALLIGLRLIAGVGEGCLLAAVTAVLASSSDPDRRYALVTALTVAFQACLIALIPWLIPDYTHTQVFAALAIVTLALAPVVFLLPRDRSDGEAAQTVFGLGGMHAYVLVLATAIWTIGSGSMWAFSVAIGEGTTLDSQQVGTAVAFSTLGGIAGGIVAAWIGRRWGRFPPILIAMIVNVIAVYFLVHTTVGMIFVVSLATATFCTFFVYPYLLGAAAEIDPLGGCAAAVGGAFILAGGGGPILGGLLTSWFGGFEGIAWGLVAATLATLGLLGYVKRSSAVLA
jgi:predicted MFS family arabinose efflux permease